MKERYRNERVDCKIAPTYIMADEKRKCVNILTFPQNEPLRFAELTEPVKPFCIILTSTKRAGSFCVATSTKLKMNTPLSKKYTTSKHAQ
jgi:hypothetical protein